MLAPALVAMALSPSLNPAQPDAAQLLRRLERLEAVGRVLYVAAHPDDENTRLLSWLIHEKKLQAAYLSVTRGDGGQNLIGPEQGPALGLLRTQELLAARRIDGADQLFTRARDFGYSKSLDESLKLWGHDRILEDVVWAYRTFKPDVVATRFHPDHLDTHGHHVASARLAVEALKAAADPKFAPEQVALVGTWQVLRVVWNKSSFFVRPGEDLSRHMKEDIGSYDPLLGVSTGEIAADSRSMHKSQGFGAPRQRGPSIEYFDVLAGEPAKVSFLEGVPTELRDGKLRQALRRARVAFKAEAPYLAIPALLEALDAVPEERRRDIEEAIVACAALHLEAITRRHSVSPGGSLPVALGALLRSPAKVELLSVTLPSGEVAASAQLAAQVGWEAKAELAVPSSAPISDPAWLKLLPEEGHYPIEAIADRTLPEPSPALWADFALRIDGRVLRVRRPVLARWVDPVQGERTRAAIVAPPVTVDATSQSLLFPDGKPRTLRVIVRATSGAARGTVQVEAPAGFTVEPSALPFQLETAAAEAELRFEVTAAEGAREGTLRLVADVGGAKWDRGLRLIDHAHVPIQQWHPRTGVRLARFDLRRGPSRVGYVAGPGDEVAPSLAQVGYSIVPLDETALRDGDFSGLDAIVVGVRAFNVHPWLAAQKPRLLEWVERGGVLVVQYQTRNRLSKLSEPLGPFPFTVSQERVTDEAAQVTFAQPDHAVLRTPNVLGPADFAGWVQERGLYFGAGWDPRYDAPLAMNDPGEPSQRGSLLVARHGKGRFVYTGLAFFRQLPAGVPGAFRLFANLLAKEANAF